MKHFGVKWNGAILPSSILPHSAILPQHSMSHFAPDITFGENAVCQLYYCPLLNLMMWKCEQEVHNHIYHMQRFYYLICQSNLCQNESKLIYQKGDISLLWDTQNVVDCKFDLDVWRWTGRWQKSGGRENRPTPDMLFSKHSVFHVVPMFHFVPTYYICYYTPANVPQISLTPLAHFDDSKFTYNV